MLNETAGIISHAAYPSSRIIHHNCYEGSKGVFFDYKRLSLHSEASSLIHCGLRSPLNGGGNRLPSFIFNFFLGNSQIREAGIRRLRRTLKGQLILCAYPSFERTSQQVLPLNRSSVWEQCLLSFARRGAKGLRHVVL